MRLSVRTIKGRLGFTGTPLTSAVVPFTLLGKRRGVKLVIGCAGILWGTSATCFAAVKNYQGAFACRFFIGLGGE